MADTPRVTVPVDYETLSELHTLKGWLHGLANHMDLCDVVADGGVTAGMAYQQEATEFAGRLRRILDGPLSAAPAPEGGAVPEDVRRLVIAARNVAFDTPTQSELRALDIASEAFASRVPWDDEPEALAAREEAPAEAGEISDDVLVEVIHRALGGDGWAYSNYGHDERRYCRDVMIAAGRAVLALRAQPPAREDALPLGCFCDEADCPSCSSINPAPDALRVAVEVLEWYGEQARLARLIHSEGDAGRHALADDGGKRARQALAALQAEQKGGA